MITTQVTDTVSGRPAVGLPVVLDFFVTGEGWLQVGDGATDSSGEILDFGENAAPGIYRLIFDVAAYQPDTFYPTITITFEARDAEEPYHMPLLLSRYAYSTHRAM
jgi:5-hydroxyisourate hydrolase